MTLSFLSPSAPRLQATPSGGAEAGTVESAHSNESLRTTVDQFFRQHHVALIKFFSARLHSVHEAKDVAQETYEWLLQHQDDPRVVRWVGPINPLIYRVAWHIAGNRMAKRQRHMRLGVQMLDAAAPMVAVAPEQLCAAREDLEIIQECLKELPPRCRMVFILARLEGLSFEEIARRMNISVRSVYRYVERSLEHCLRRLEEGDLPAGQKQTRKSKSVKRVL